jgi:hypothetical protein
MFDTNLVSFETSIKEIGNTIETEGYAVSDVDFYVNLWDSSVITSTVLIQCDTGSNVLKQIFINRTNGIPREGIIIDCSGNIDTIDYLVSTVRATASDVFRFPKIYDDSITIVTYKSLIFNIIDLNDGNVIFEENVEPVSQGDDTTTIIYSPDGQGIKIKSIGHNLFGTNDDTHKTISFGSIPAGVYFFNFFDEDGNIIFSKTIIKKEA